MKKILVTMGLALVMVFTGLVSAPAQAAYSSALTNHSNVGVWHTYYFGSAKGQGTVAPWTTWASDGGAWYIGWTWWCDWRYYGGSVSHRVSAYNSGVWVNLPSGQHMVITACGQY